MAGRLSTERPEQQMPSSTVRPPPPTLLGNSSQVACPLPVVVLSIVAEARSLERAIAVDETAVPWPVFPPHPVPLCQLL